MDGFYLRNLTNSVALWSPPEQLERVQCCQLCNRGVSRLFGKAIPLFGTTEIWLRASWCMK